MDKNIVPWFRANAFGNMLMWFYVGSSNEAREALVEDAGASDHTAGISQTHPKLRAT